MTPPSADPSRSSARFEELAWRSTPLGDLSLRRRRDPALGIDVFEVKLDDDFLMSSLFTVAEIEVARLALQTLDGTGLDVVVGGLGLGYTAQAVLNDARVASLIVIERLADVIDWHRAGLLPLGAGLAGDDRCRLVEGDFFALVAAGALDAEQTGRTFDAIVVDIDHSPRHLLHPSHATFYDHAGTERIAAQLRPGGVFSLWSNDPVDQDYLSVLRAVFADAAATVVTFPNAFNDGDATNTVYTASVAS